jgi:phosphoglucosamine mutase
MTRFFGTDGIRGEYNGTFLNEAFACKIGQAVGSYLLERHGELGTILLAQDTRSSGVDLLKSCALGIQSKGATCYTAGIIPTPALAFGVRQLGAQLGIMITASHNPHTDNGIKFFVSDGTKLSPHDEEIIEDLLSQQNEESNLPDQLLYQANLAEDYAEKIISLFPPHFLKGLNIGIDYANGATKWTSSRVLKALGATLIELNQGDGLINQNCGSEYPQSLQDKVLNKRLDLGIAHDGDGDRMVLVDHQGTLIDGDQILGLLAIHAKSANQLRGESVVTTVHSNSGLDASLKQHNISAHRSSVGDRNVFRMMVETGCNLGGESSGHIIFNDYLPTGDGLYSALMVLEALISSNKKIAELAQQIELWPCLCRSFQVKSKPPLGSIKTLSEVLDSEKKLLGKNGRILLRYSGTEPKIRLLVEARSENLIQPSFDRIAHAIQIAL